MNDEHKAALRVQYGGHFEYGKQGSDPKSKHSVVVCSLAFSSGRVAFEYPPRLFRTLWPQWVRRGGKKYGARSHYVF